MFSATTYIEPKLTPSQRRRAESLAEALRREHEELIVPAKFSPLVADDIHTAPAIHLDDQSAIVSTLELDGSSYVQDRARVRAFTGDYLVTASSPPESYAAYCERQLGLGKVDWLTASAPGDPRRLASRAMQDRHVRHKLVHALRQERVLYVHPYMGHDEVWELAHLLRETARRPVKVLAPFPGLTRWVNDKVCFAETVSRLFAGSLVPETHEASNLSILSERVRDLGRRGLTVVIKVPDSASGAGNLRIDAPALSGQPLADIRRTLEALLTDLPWQGDRHLLVSSWETSAFGAPSVQLWIPPLGHGDPVVEGVFEQEFQGANYSFIGSRAVEHPQFLVDEIATRAVLLCLTFQHLGYVGRCSMDLILTGKRPASCRIEFIEANGRWGGTSTPMTLVNRLFDHWWQRPYVARGLRVPGLDKVRFHELVDGLSDELVDVRSGSGRLVLYNPASIEARGVVHVIGFGDTTEAAVEFLESNVIERLRGLVH